MGNWLPCPTAAQLDAYSHIGEQKPGGCLNTYSFWQVANVPHFPFFPLLSVVAFAVSYSWVGEGIANNCDTSCNIGGVVPVCNNNVNQAVVDGWRAAGKKVILSFGGE